MSNGPLLHCVVDRQTGRVVYYGSFEECQIYIAKRKAHKRYAIKIA